MNFCLIFAYHVVSRKTSIETAFLVATTLLFRKVSALPLDYSSNTTRSDSSNSTKKTKQEPKHERKQRSVTVKNQFHQGDCGTKWFEKENQCYGIFKEKMNYKSAKEHCGTHKSKLVTVRGNEDNEFVYQLSNKFNIAGYLWISVYNVCRNCTLYRNWYPGYPSGKSDCVVMVNAGKWKNFDCGYRFTFVCEKAVTKPLYSRETLLIGLLVPIFSCITVAVGFTTALLVSSIRRGNQPFKISSRYAPFKKTQRRIPTWEMIDTLRRASLKRRSSKQKQSRESAPNIEVTKPVGEKTENANGIQVDKTAKKGRWYKKSLKQDTGLQAPVESPNSSLYELLLRLNGTDFVQPRYNQGIELHELRENTEESAAGVLVVNEKLNEGGNGEHSEKNGKVFQEITANEILSKDGNGDHSEKNGKVVQKCSKENCSFRNMAFRDSKNNSMVAMETSGNGEVEGKSLNVSPGENTEVDTHDADSIKLNSHLASGNDVDVIKGESLESNKNTTTVKVDVHRISMAKEPPSINESMGTNDEKTSECNKEIAWTYSI